MRNLHIYRDKVFSWHFVCMWSIKNKKNYEDYKKGEDIDGVAYMWVEALHLIV